MTPKNGKVLAKAAHAIAIYFFVSVSIFFFPSAGAQNIVVSTARSISTANPAKLTETDFSEFILNKPASSQPAPLSRAGQRVADKLDRHIADFLAGTPFAPFHHTLGISGAEIYFDHPDELFYCLAMALPWTSPVTSTNLRTFLQKELAVRAPYALPGFDHQKGKRRESFDVPEALRSDGEGKARSAAGVYAFWVYVANSGDRAAAVSHWPAIKARTAPLLAAEYSFDVQRNNTGRDEAEILNGDLAGMIGLIYLARLNADADTERLALDRGRQLMEWRVNIDRQQPQLIEKTHSARKSLHNFKISRHCGLVPEIAAALRVHTDGLAKARLQAVREERNGWYLAFGDRLIGGENYTNPLHFSRALFAGAAMVEQLPASALLELVDVPWCRGDFYFIEKCVYALRAAATPIVQPPRAP